MAVRTLYPWFVLAREEVSDHRVVSWQMILPIYLCQLIILLALILYLRDVGLFLNAIQVFVQSIQQVGKQLWGILLDVAAKLRCVSAYHVLDVPRRDAVVLRVPKILQQIRVRASQLPSCSEWVLLVDVGEKIIGNHKVGEFGDVAQALQRRIHKTSVTEIV